MTKNILEEISTKPTSICLCVSIVLVTFFEQSTFYVLNVKELRFKFWILVGYYSGSPLKEQEFRLEIKEL